MIKPALHEKAYKNSEDTIPMVLFKTVFDCPTKYYSIFSLVKNNNIPNFTTFQVTMKTNYPTLAEIIFTTFDFFSWFVRTLSSKLDKSFTSVNCNLQITKPLIIISGNSSPIISPRQQICHSLVSLLL